MRLHDPRLLVVCVLRSGGVYDHEYVDRLFEGVYKNLKGNYDFICLTDTEIYISGALFFPLKHNWPGWWSKMEVFKIKGKVLYLDLDTVITGSLDRLFCDEFTMIKDFYYPKSKSPFGSGVMAWNGDYQYIYEAFQNDPDKNMEKYRKNAGDQKFIVDHLGFTPDTFKEGDVVSYKKHKNRKNSVVTCYHGKPKPHETGWKG